MVPGNVSVPVLACGFMHVRLTGSCGTGSKVKKGDLGFGGISMSSGSAGKTGDITQA